MSKIVLVSDQPVLLRGFSCVLEARGFETLPLIPDPEHGFGQGVGIQPDLILLDITAGLTFGTLTELHNAIPDCPVVLWADAMPLELIFKTLEFGVRGIVPRTSRPEQLADSLQRVVGGEMHIGFTGPAAAGPPKRNVSLTPREREIVMHLRQGLRNKQIATEMNITEGTVKIYLFRLFHKLGVRNRFELARSGAVNMAVFNGNPEPELMAPYRSVPVM